MMPNFLERFFLVGIACLCWLSMSATASDVLTKIDSTHTEISHVQDLSVTDLSAAITELSALYHNEAAHTSLAERRDILIALVDLYIRSQQVDSATKFNTELADLGNKNKDVWATAMALDYQAGLLRNQGKLLEAREVIEHALVLADKVQVKVVTSQVNTEAGFVYQEQGNFKAALKHLLASLDAIEGDSVFANLRRATTLNAICTLYLDLKDPDMGLEYIEKATKIAESLNAKNMLAKLEINRGNVYSDKNNLPEASKSYQKALEMARTISDKGLEIIAVNNIADVAFSQKQYSKCVQYANETFALASRSDNKPLIASADINMGLCHIGLGSFQQGANEVALGLAYLRSFNARPDIEQVMGQLASVYEKAGLYKEAYRAMEEQRSLSMELFRDDRDRSVAEMKAKFDAKEQEKQIELLEQKNQVQSIEIKNKSLQRVVFILAALIAAAIAVTIFYLYRKVRETNRNLQEANVKLEHQSSRDPLTGLLNRRAFHDMMKFRTQMIERRNPDAAAMPPHALIILDIDHFKLVNDNYGHAGGDVVLVEISRRLSHVMREQDMLMRWGGEEFLIFLNHIPPDNLTRVVERILITVGARPIELEQHQLQVTISAGYISLLPGVESEIDANWEKSLHLADSALYMAKTRGRNRAIGIKTIEIPKEDLDQLLQGDLEKSIREGKVSIQQIEGPVQHETVTEF